MELTLSSGLPRGVELRVPVRVLDGDAVDGQLGVPGIGFGPGSPLKCHSGP